jgi:hypothetical protein
MKRILLVILTLLSIESYCQVPHSFNYQGVSRDNLGNPIINSSISVRTSIHDGSSIGPIQYQETQITTTNNFGLFKMEIGNGTPTINVFDSIKWNVGTKFLEIEFDPTGGTSYILSGTTQILSVPYALHSGDFTNDNIFISTLSPTLKSETGNFNIKDSRLWLNNHLTIMDTAGSFTGNQLIMWVSDSTENSYITSRGTPQLFPLILQYTEQGTVAGNVGIGTDSPSEQLTVNGNISFTQRGQKLFFKGTPNDTSTCYIYRPVGTDGVYVLGNDINIKSTVTPMELQTTSNVKVSGGDVNITDINSGVILRSPNGNCWRVTVDNSGNLLRTSIVCP